MSVEHNIAVFEKFVEIGLNKKDLLSIADEILAPDLVLEAPGIPTEAGKTNGNELFRQSVLGFVGAFPDVKCSMKYTAAEGDTVAVDLPYEGTHLKEFAGVGPTGMYIHGAELWFVEYADGKMKNVRICEYGTPLRSLLLAVHP
jgi:predicted ester cyclase